MKPWLGAVVAPTKLPPTSAERPSQTLTLRNIHGYRSNYGRDNVRVLGHGAIVYPAACFAVVRGLGKKSDEVRHLLHEKEVCCLDVDPTGRYVATGTLGVRCPLTVWDTVTGKKLAVAQRVHMKAFAAIRFSPSGKFIASVGGDDKHT